MKKRKERIVRYGIFEDEILMEIIFMVFVVIYKSNLLKV